MVTIPHRLDGIDYRARRIYHITMTTEGRRPLLGTLVGDAAIPAGHPGAPQVLPTPLGTEVLRCLLSIPQYHSEVRLLTWQLMPDHLHFILFITAAGGAHLGRIILGFKQGCNKAYRRLYPATVVGEPAIISQAHQQPHQQTHQQPHQQTHQPRPRPTTEQRKHGELWSASYYETPLSGRGQLGHMTAYVLDNPRRLLLKRQHSALFRPYPLTAAGLSFTAVGDAAILSQHQQPQPPHQPATPPPFAPAVGDAAILSQHHQPQPLPCPRQAVQLSTHLYDAEIAIEVARHLDKARSGVLMISPFISRAEKAVMAALQAEALPYVRLDGNGFGPYYKPSGLDCDLVASGLLLILSPWAPRPHLHRADFMALNAMARQLADGPL